VRVIDFEDYVAQQLARASFTTQRRGGRWALLILGLLTLAVASGALFVGQLILPASILGILAVSAGVILLFYEWRFRGARVLRNQLRAGLRGQRRLVKLLSALDDGYYLINNLQLPGRADDIDHLVVGPSGIFALETKNHRGRIFCQDGQWYQAKISHSGRPQPAEPIRDPVRQLKRNVDYLRSCINATDPGLSRRTRLWIEGTVVFTHPTVTIDLPPRVERSLPFPALRAQELPNHIQGRRPRQRLSKADIREIVSMFGHLELPEPRSPQRQ
jgi:hypothetical protein